jgi:hypothetical protein
VGPPVLFYRGTVGEPSPANIAGIRFLPCVSPHVTRQVLDYHEAPPTNGARVVFLARVGQLVPPQILNVGKRLGAQVASVGLVTCNRVIT